MMHKGIKRLFFIATLGTIFSGDCIAQTKNEKKQAKPIAESTYVAQDPFKDDFDDFFKDIDSWFYGPSIKPKSTEETSMRSLMKDIQTWSENAKNATNSLSRLRNKSFSALAQELKDIQAKLEASTKNLQDLIGRTEKESENSKKARTFAVVQDSTSDASYTVTVDVPGINKDDVVVTVHAGDQTHKEGNTLEISTKEKVDKAPKEPGVKTHFERHMQSSVSDNGHIKTKDYHFSYDNGAIRITQKLPDDIDPDKYTMTFNDEKIVIVFEKKAGAKKVKALEFSEKASKKGKTCAEK